MRTLAGIIIAILFYTTAIAEDFDFRSTRWGMSKLDVMAVETAFYQKEDPDNLVYLTEILNKEVLLVYTFLDDKLVKAWYTFTEQYADNNLYINQYHTTNSALRKKYGKPKSDDINWYNHTYDGNDTMYGYAISVGHLSLSSEWDLPRTSIMLLLSGENYDILCSIYYTSKLHTDLIRKFDEAAQKDATDGL